MWLYGCMCARVRVLQTQRMYVRVRSRVPGAWIATRCDDDASTVGVAFTDHCSAFFLQSHLLSLLLNILIMEYFSLFFHVVDMNWSSSKEEEKTQGI